MYSFEFFNDNFKSFPIKKCANVNSVEFINEVKSFRPDLFISIRFGKIFKDDIIKIPKNGLLNLHSAILPDFRGIMGTLHAIKAKNNIIGCTLHTIPNSGIDTGEIIEIATFKINWKKSLLWHIIQLYPLGVELILKSIRKIECNNSLESQEQNLNSGNYFSVPTESDFEQIRGLGMEVFSKNDYVNILNKFIFEKLKNQEKRHLTRAIVNTDFGA